MKLEERIMSCINLGLLKFPDIVKLRQLQTCLFLHDCLSDKEQSNFNFSLVSEHHSYNTRSASSEKLKIPSYRINLRKFCPTVIGRYFWNDIPLSIRNIKPKISFKKALKTYYLKQYWVKIIIIIIYFMFRILSSTAYFNL